MKTKVPSLIAMNRLSISRIRVERLIRFPGDSAGYRDSDGKAGFAGERWCQ